MNDLTMTALEDALRGLATRQRVIADNIANVQTPGFLARRVDFESSLRSAIDSGMASPATVDISQSTAPTRLDGNNVNLDDETVDLMQTGLRYQTMLEGMNAKFRLLGTAIRGEA
jgi:flagellar basal-body rod protein FlgB